jgi:hypothetical protein
MLLAIQRALPTGYEVHPISNDMFGALVEFTIHHAAREMLVAVEQPGDMRPVVLPNSPIKCTETPTGVYRRPPLLGEHNAEILEELRTGR